MARYDYRCEDCDETFEVEEPMSEHGGDEQPECPSCGSEDTRQVMSPFYPETSDKT